MARPCAARARTKARRPRVVSGGFLLCCKALGRPLRRRGRAVGQFEFQLVTRADKLPWMSCQKKCTLFCTRFCTDFCTEKPLCFQPGDFRAKFLQTVRKLGRVKLRGTAGQEKR